MSIYRDTVKVDKLLITTNATILVGFFFVFQVNLQQQLIKWVLLISLTLYCISIVLLIWHVIRFPRRLKLLEELRKKTAGKYAKRIKLFMDEILLPFARLRARDDVIKKLSLVKSEEEHKALMADIQQEIKELEAGDIKSPRSEGEKKAEEYIIEGFLDQVVNESKAGHRKAFKEPLAEKYAKLKLWIDILAMRSRWHFFAAASVFAVLSIFIQILASS